MSFSTPPNAHSSTKSGAISKPHPAKSPLSHVGSTPPTGLASSARGSGQREGTSRLKDDGSVASKCTGDSVGGSETREPERDHLQLLISQQLTQHKRVAMAGLGKV